MGNGASSSQIDQADGSLKERNNCIKVKTVAVGNFGKHSANHEIHKYSRQELIDFLCEQRKERNELDSALDMEETSVDRFRIRPKTAGVRRSTTESREADWRKVQIKVESDAACYLCDETIPFLISGYPCRVCTRIFHKDCLEQYDGCRAGDLDMMERAHCITGWSCYRCGDLTTLLTNEETRIMIEEFDKRDINGDAVISKEEYLKYKSRVYEEEEQEPIPEHELRRHRLMYQLMDADRNGAIDWWEFVNRQCTRVLAKRKKVQAIKSPRIYKRCLEYAESQKSINVSRCEDLAQLLTDKETLRLKEQFEAMDDNEDGVIEFEARKTHSGWLTSFGGDVRSSAVFAAPEDLASHVEEGSRFFSRADVNKSGTLSWEEFKNEQALYVLSNRPNIRMPSRDWND